MRKAFRIILYIFCSLLLLVIGGIVYLNTPSGQNFVRTKAVAFLKNKLKTDIRIGHLGYGLPKYIVLNDVLFLDEHKDTLLSAGELKIDLAMLRLIHKKVDVQELVFKDVHSHIYRTRTDTDYNFSYIVDAFTGNKPKSTAKPKDTSGASLQIDLNHVKFDDVHVHFDDYAGGMRLAVNLDHLDLKMKKVDINNLAFHVKELTVRGLQTAFSQDSSFLPPKPNDTAKTKLQLIADHIDLQDVGFHYDDALHKFLFGLQLGKANIELNNFNLGTDVIDLSQLVLDKADVSLTMGTLSTAPAFVDTLVKVDTTAGWHVTAGNVAITNSNFKMDNQSVPRQKSGIDYSHLFFQHAALSMVNFLYTSDTIAGNIKNFSGTEQCGLDVKELNTLFHYDPQGATLNNLYLQTPGTTLQNHIEVHYPSLAALQKRMQSLQLILDIKNSKVSMQDVLLFVPQLSSEEIFAKFKNSSINLEAVVNGALDNLNIAHLYVAGLSNTEVLLNGRVAGLPDAKAITYHLNVTRLISSRKDISSFVPDSVLSSIRVPDKIGVMGNISGTTQDYNTDMLLVSTDGRAYVKGVLSMAQGKNKQTYDMEVKTDRLNIGHILKRDSLMGTISGDFRVKGHSFDVKTMNATADMEITGAEIKGYRYHDIAGHAEVNNQVAKINFKAADSNLRINLKAGADFSGKYASLVADMQIDSIDFHALKLYGSDLRTSGTIHADFPVLNLDYPRGKLVWQQPVITTNGKRYYVDSLYITSDPGADSSQNIVADLEVMQANITGKTPLTKLAAIVQDHINRHYAFGEDSTKNGQHISQDIAVQTAKKTGDTITLPADYNLSLQAHIIDRPLLHSLLSGLTSLDSVHIDGSLTPRILTLNVGVPNVVYGSNTIQNGAVTVRGTDSAFTYKVTADQINLSGYSLWYADIHGNLNKNLITTNVSLSDVDKKEQFALAGSFEQVGDSQIISLQKGLKLNYDSWDVAQPNKIVYAKGGVYAYNFDISHSGQSIKLNSSEEKINSPLKIEISDFLISNVTKAISKADTLLAGGTLNGSVTIDQLQPSLKAEGDLKITGLSILGDTLGDLQAQVSTPQENVLDSKISLKGHGNDIALNGKYYLQPTGGNDFDMTLDLNTLSIRSFEAIAKNEIRNSSGYVRGHLKIQGTPTSPKITGELTTDSLVTTISQLNATYKMPAEKLSFSNGAIDFSGTSISLNNFTLHDSADNKAIFTGSINFSDISDISLNCSIKAKNWRVAHSTAKDNKNFYGDLLITTNLDIKGPVSAPSVEGDLKILKGTNFSVVNPTTDPQLQDSKGIVAFVNMKDTGRKDILRPKAKDTVTKKLAVGSGFNVNISVDKAAQFTFVIDQSSGDFLSVKGDATINASVSPGGIMSLSGSYELHGGMYQMDYDFIKRKFNIKDGSIITFAGDPVTGTRLDVSAIYEAQVAPYDLVEQEVTDPTQLNYYKQQLPFDVDLHLNGKILAPRITFDVDLPENKVYPLSAAQIELVQGKLSQVRADTSELNKQVFAVLILGRFVSDDPFTSGAANSTAFTALQSVSTFIGEELNQAAGKFIKGVDFSVDLAETEDYTTGNMQQRTDLNLAASKQLMNNRLKLTIGNDFELQGPQTNNAPSSVVPTNLAADYLLSTDGKYSMRAYRKVYDEGVLEGFVTETGLDFIVNLNFNHFNEIFRKNDDEPAKDSTDKK